MGELPPKESSHKMVSPTFYKIVKINTFLQVVAKEAKQIFSKIIPHSVGGHLTWKHSRISHRLCTEKLHLASNSDSFSNTTHWYFHSHPPFPLNWAVDEPHTQRNRLSQHPCAAHLEIRAFNHQATLPTPANRSTLSCDKVRTCQQTGQQLHSQLSADNQGLPAVSSEEHFYIYPPRFPANQQQTCKICPRALLIFIKRFIGGDDGGEAEHW